MIFMLGIYSRETGREIYDIVEEDARRSRSRLRALPGLECGVLV